MNLEVEMKREIARGAKKVTSFGAMAVAPIDIASIKEGDVITIPANWNENILEAPVRGSYREESVTDANGIEIGKKKVQVTAMYVKLPCKRGASETFVNFYPSFFTKNRMDVATGEFKRASGTAVDEVQNYATMDEAFAALAGKSIKVTKLERFKTYRFGSTTETQNAWVPVLDIVA